MGGWLASPSGICTAVVVAVGAGQLDVAIGDAKLLLDPNEAGVDSIRRNFGGGALPSSNLILIE